MGERDPFAAELPRAAKQRRGRTGVGATPLAIRSRVAFDDAARARARETFGRKLGKYASQIERITLRLEDVNGPRGGRDIVCRVTIALSGLPSVVVAERGDDVAALVVRTAKVAERTLRSTLRKRGRSSRPARGRSRAKATAAARTVSGVRGELEDGSLIGRRVGHAPANLARALARPEKQRRDAYVDTSAPGLSASDRRAGGGATARRNTKADGSGLTSALEDSRTTPSRKSTRKAAHRARPAAPLERNESLQRQTPQAKSLRARAAQRGKRPMR